jgi:hypothetical protein
MSTQRKINSARANGAKSHGPITGQGRKTSSMNALKHGLTAKTVVLSNENDDEYNGLLESYVQELQPTGPVEMDLVVEMANAKWRQRRLHNMETELFERQMEDQKEMIDADYKSYDAVLEQTYAFRTLAHSVPLQMLNRMETRLERTYSRALNNFLRLRRLRESSLDTGNKKGEKRTQSQDRTPVANHQPPLPEAQHELNLPPQKPPLPLTVGKFDPVVPSIGRELT